MNQGYFGKKRLVERFVCLLTGKYFDENNSPCKLDCEDISLKGARVLTPLPLMINSHLSFDVTTKKADLLALAGTVCWSKKSTRGYRSGVAFDQDLQLDIGRII